MTAIIVSLLLAGSAVVPQPDPYVPRHKGCQTKACDKRVDAKHRKAALRKKRRVQARHKAQVRAERHVAKMRNVISPYLGWLASTRSCESGGNYATNTGNGFFGAYQFTLSSWRAAGGWGMPNLASRLEQDYRAVRLLHIQGRGAWPVCG